MDTRSRRPILLLLPLVVLALAACGPSGASGTTSAAPTSVAPASERAAQPGPLRRPGRSGHQRGAHDRPDRHRLGSHLGRRPDRLPDLPGSTLAEDAGLRDVSGAWALEGGDPRTMANWFQAAPRAGRLQHRVAVGPAGGRQLPARLVGEDGCKVEVQVAPTGGLVLVSVKYGAACPNV